MIEKSLSFFKRFDEDQTPGPLDIIPAIHPFRRNQMTPKKRSKRGTRSQYILDTINEEKNRLT